MREIELRELMDCIWLSSTKRVDILAGMVNHSRDCARQVACNTIFDIYANLYYIFDSGPNAAHYDECLPRMKEKNDEIARAIEQLWNEHTTAAQPYDNVGSLMKLHPETLPLIAEDLQRSEDRAELLLRMINWLKTLDKYLAILNETCPLRILEQWDYYHRQKQMSSPLSTERGVLLFKRQTKYPYDKRKDPPGRRRLKYQVNTLFLARHIYRNFTVRHLYYYPPHFDQIKTVEEISIAFLPGEASASLVRSSDMAAPAKAGVRPIRFIEEEITADGKTPFYFDSAEEEDYFANIVEKPFKAILENEPHIIILPEFFSPLPVQARLAEYMNLEEASSVAMLIPGSYHVMGHMLGGEAAADERFNYSRITGHDGTCIADIFKMNKFIQVTPDKVYTENHKFDINELTFIETDIGRMMISICVDFIDPEIVDIMIDRHVNLVFVMSFTPKPAGGHFFRHMFQVGDENDAAVFLCNNLGLTRQLHEMSQAAEARAGAGPHPGAEEALIPGIVVYLPREKPKEIMNIDQQTISVKDLVSKIYGENVV